MKIKTRLSLQFTTIVVGILFFFSLLVYYFSYSSQVTKFRKDLLDNAKNTAILLINVTEVDSSLLKKIHQSTVLWKREEIALTDSAYKLIYANNIQYLSDSVRRISSDNYYVKFFSIREKDGIRYRHNFNNRTYLVFFMAYDNNRHENLSELSKILLWSILFSLLLSVLLSYIFSRKAIQPIVKLIKSIKNFNSLRLSHRLDEGTRKDEIEQLAVTFNEMITKLEYAFINQQDFVSNASHELRTPLTIMIGESDYFLNHEHEKESYIKHISGLVTELKNLNVLLNSLLELAQISRDTTLQLSNVRIDEIIYNAIQEVKIKYPGRRVIPKIQYPENANDLLINGNPGLLNIAFKNLIENACKFSDEDVSIEFIIMSNFIKITISDLGIGIPPADFENIYKPFKRASNVRFKGGYGVGLSLVSRIIELHNAGIQVFSELNRGTRFEVTFSRKG